MVNGTARIGYIVPWYYEVEERQLRLQPENDDAYCDFYYYEHENQAPGTPNATPQMTPDGDIVVVPMIYRGTRMERVITVTER